MLKRAAALFLSVLYLVTATGFALNLHFCGDSITTISINAPAKAPSGCVDGMSCCTNKHLVVKVKDAHLAQPTNLQAKLPALVVPALVQPCFSFNFKQVLAEAFISKRPPDPPLTNVDSFLKNRVFRI
jgi:hypothetical protein